MPACLVQLAVIETDRHAHRFTARDGGAGKALEHHQAATLRPLPLIDDDLFRRRQAGAEGEAESTERG